MNKIVKAFRMAAIAVCLSVTLNACASMSYQKAGGTAAEWQQVQAICELEATRQVPPDYTVEIISGFASTSKSCGKHGCTTTSTFTPPEAVRVDQNTQLRDKVSKGCFARHGWTLQPK